MKKTLSVVIALVLMAQMLCACAQSGASSAQSGTSSVQSAASSSQASGSASASEQSTSSAAKSGNADVSGKLLGWQWADGTMSAAADAFRKAYPKVDLEIVNIPQADYPTKIQTTVASGGEMADMFLTDVAQRGTLYTLDIYENLEAAPYNLDRKEIIEGDWPIIQNYSGNIVGLDLCVCPTVWAYKLDVAKKWLGTSDPDKIQPMVDTWDKFIETGKKVLSDSKGKVKMMSTLDWVGDALQKQTGKAIINDKTVDTALVHSYFEQMLKVRDAGIIGETEVNSPAWAACYTSEDYMFYATPSWGLVYLLHANDPHADGSYGAILPAGGTYSMGGAALSIFNGSKNKAAAWEYAKMLCLSDVGADALKASVGYISPYLKAWDRDGYTSYPDKAFPNQDVGKLLYDVAAKQMKVIPLNPYGSYLSDAFNSVSSALRTDPKYTADAAMKDYETAVKTATPDVTFK